MACAALTSDSALDLGNYLLSFRPRIGEASWFTLTRSEGVNDDGHMTLQLQNWAAQKEERPTWAASHDTSEGERGQAEPVKRPRTSGMSP